MGGGDGSREEGLATQVRVWIPRTQVNQSCPSVTQSSRREMGPQERREGGVARRTASPVHKASNPVANKVKGKNHH